jgi:ABC-2 type transport system permease protein
MITRIWTLTLKEVIQLWRDRMILLFVILGPISELTLVAWATSGSIEHIPTVVVDQDRTPTSRRFLQSLENTATFDANYYVPDEVAARSIVDAGTALVAVLIPPGFERSLVAVDDGQLRCKSSSM